MCICFYVDVNFSCPFVNSNVFSWSPTPVQVMPKSFPQPQGWEDPNRNTTGTASLVGV